MQPTTNWFASNSPVPLNKYFQPSVCFDKFKSKQGDFSIGIQSLPYRMIQSMNEETETQSQMKQLLV